MKLEVHPQSLICVRDVKASSRWYQRLLGCQSGHGGSQYEQLIAKSQLLLQLHSWRVEPHHGPIGKPDLVYMRQISQAIRKYADDAGEVLPSLSAAVASNNMMALSLKHHSRTALVVEGSVPGIWSWHAPSPHVLFNDAQNVVNYVDGHVSYIKIYFNRAFHGSVSQAFMYAPPAGYEYQWSPN